MADDDYEEKYTKPDLRRKIKDELMQSDKGGKAGEWSARKSQMLVQEYERQGGGYKKDKKDEAARSLEAWTAQRWQTKEGKGEARKGGITKRYLPKEVWDRLSDEEKKEAEEQKKEGSEEGDQFVQYTPAVRRAMQEAGIIEGENGGPTKEALYDQAQELRVEGRSQMSKDELEEAVREAEADRPENQTKGELYERAQELDIEGRSQMSKDELANAIRNAER